MTFEQKQAALTLIAAGHSDDLYVATIVGIEPAEVATLRSQSPRKGGNPQRKARK